MRMKRSRFVQIVKEELARHVALLAEAEDKKPEVKDADQDVPDDEGTPPAKKKTQDPGKTQKSKEPPPPAPEADPADEPLEKDAETEDEVEDAAEVTGGEISDQIVGQTVQSIVMEPKSKIMPGAQEITITFNQKPDPLRILITKSGAVKFFYKGLHNAL